MNTKKTLRDYCEETGRTQILDEWDYEKNLPATPDNTTPFSDKKMHWRCEKGHTWEQTVRSRVKRTSYDCPICANRILLSGYNDLVTLYPDLCKEWHPTKNGDQRPEDFLPTSYTRVWWICEKGHEWEARIDARTKLGTGCPVCAGMKVIPGVNDLASQYPAIAKEWHPTRNSILKPDQVYAHSTKSYWWQCEQGHEWFASVAKRVQGKFDCPICTGKDLFAAPEDSTELLYGGLNVLRGMTDLATKAPEIAKEWHPTKNGGLLPSQVSYGDNKKYWWLCPKGHEYQASPNNRVSHQSGCPYCNNKLVLPGFNDFATRYPEVAAEWHPTKNGDLSPDQLMPSSKNTVWWLCPKGHEWQGTIGSRTRRQRTCPICKEIEKEKIRKEEEIEKALLKEKRSRERREKRRIQEQENEKLRLEKRRMQEQKKEALRLEKTKKRKEKRTESLHDYCERTGHLEYLVEWDDEKNLPLTPENTRKNSGDEVFWKCPEGHEWSSTVGERVLSYAKCPYCAGRLPVPGVNDLASQYPELAREWHPTKNGALTPDRVKAYVRKKVWWQGDCGHEWEDFISERIDRGRGCPYCEGRKILPGENDLATVCPEIAAEWHPTKNGKITPADVTWNADRFAWWRDTSGRSWREKICERTKGKK